MCNMYPYYHLNIYILCVVYTIASESPHLALKVPMKLSVPVPATDTLINLVLRVFTI